jgi:hypothetical protein
VVEPLDVPELPLLPKLPESEEPVAAGCGEEFELADPLPPPLPPHAARTGMRIAPTAPAVINPGFIGSLPVLARRSWRRRSQVLSTMSLRTGLEPR